jgi:TetR/AcrR family transcriptional regulator, tetracycline repressor protein
MRPVKPARRPRSSLSTEQLIATAVDIVNAEGADALSIRRLAAACEVTPMAIYRHVRDKDELLDRVVEQVVAGTLPAILASDGPWYERVWHLFHLMRDHFLRHPGVAAICVMRPTPVTAVARFYDAVIAALLDSGCSADQAIHVFDTLLLFTFGSVLWQLPRRDSERERLIRQALEHPTRAPNLLQHAARLTTRDPTEYFERGLEMILTGLTCFNEGHGLFRTTVVRGKSGT